MDVSEIDKKIKEGEEKIVALYGGMANSCKEFLEATKQFAAEWIEKQAETTSVKTHPDITNRLSEEEIAQLKKEVGQLAARIPELVECHVTQDDLWAHRKKELLGADASSLPPYFISHNHVPTALDNAVREVLGHLGEVLVRRDLAKDDEYSNMTVNGALRYRRYRGAVNWSPGMRTHITNYSDFYKNFEELYWNLKRLKRQKEEAQAKRLWDKA